MVHIFEDIRTCTPANHNEAALGATMPQAAWEALLRDAVQRLRPSYTPQNPPPVAPDHPPPGVGHWRPTGPPPPHQHHTRKAKGTGKGRARDGKGHPGKGARKGPK